MTFFKMKDVSVRFGGIKAVTRLSLELEQGHVYSIIGPNGAGKTTVFNLISRFYDAYEGQITFLDRDITRIKPHQVAGLGIARTFQNIELFRGATVLENLLLGRHAHKQTNFWQDALSLPKAALMEVKHRQHAEDIIEFLGVQKYRNTPIGSLSYGIRKVVELGRALCTEPVLLLLDEPSSGLNIEETQEIAHWISDIKSQLGITVLMIEHDMSLVSAVSDRVLAMDYGRVLTVGTSEEVQSHPEVIRAYLGG